MMNGMDVDYVSVCVNYVKEWMIVYGVEDWELSQEMMEYIVAKGGNGIRDLEENFHKLVTEAKKQNISKIDSAFIDKVLS